MNLDSKILQILDNSACLSKGQLSGYLSRSLYPEEVRAVELHLSECPFCSDALDGFEQEQVAIDILSRIDKIPLLPQLTPRENKVEAVLDKVVKTVTPKPSTAKVHHEAAVSKGKDNVSGGKAVTNFNTGSIDKNESSRVNWIKPLSIAAGLLIIATLLWYFQFGNDSSKKNNYIADRRGSSSEPADINGSPEAQSAEQSPLTQNTSTSIDTAFKAAQAKKKDTASRNSMTGIPVNEAPKESAASPEVNQAAEAVADVKAETLKAIPTAALKSEKSESAERKPDESIDTNNDADRKKTAKQDEKLSDYEMGVELYKQKQYGSALLYLKPAQRNSSDPRHYDAVYFSALCYKNSGQKKKAIQLLKKLVEEGAPQKSSAQKQLKELGED